MRGVQSLEKEEKQKRRKKKVKKKARESENNATEKSSSRISSYDYRSWDKFDVVRIHIATECSDGKVKVHILLRPNWSKLYYIIRLIFMSKISFLYLLWEILCSYTNHTLCVRLYGFLQW